MAVDSRLGEDPSRVLGHGERIGSEEDERGLGCEPRREVVVAITDGQLDFEPWGRIFDGELDGRRRKRVLVKIIGE